MSEPNEMRVSEPSDGDAAEYLRTLRAELPPFDPSLASLVALTNLMDTVEIGLTLHVKGVVLSGMLVSARSYFNLLVHNLREIDGGAFLADFFEPSLQQQKDAREKYLTEEIPPPQPFHIHLREVSTFATGGNAPLASRLWRGRLTEVDAWSLGNYGSAIPPLPEDLVS